MIITFHIEPILIELIDKGFIYQIPTRFVLQVKGNLTIVVD